jgi:peroxin-11B
MVGFAQANTIKFFNLQPSTAQRVNKIANRYWLAGILLSIAHGVIKVRKLLSYLADSTLTQRPIC